MRRIHKSSGGGNIYYFQPTPLISLLLLLLLLLCTPWILSTSGYSIEANSVFLELQNEDDPIASNMCSRTDGGKHDYDKSNHNNNMKKKVFCPDISNLHVFPSSMMLPSRAIEYVNTSVTENGIYHVYTATKPIVGETVVSFYSMEPCLSEGASASFNVRTDVFAQVAAASYNDMLTSVPSNIENSKNTKLQQQHQQRVWIPSPDNPTVDAYWGIDTFITIRLNREPLYQQAQHNGAFPSSHDTNAKIYCDHSVAAAVSSPEFKYSSSSFAPTNNYNNNLDQTSVPPSARTQLPKIHQSRMTSKFLVNPQTVAVLSPNRLVPGEESVDDLAEHIFPRAMQELKVEIEEVAKIMFARALRNASACVAFPVSMDNLFGYRPPHGVSDNIKMVQKTEGIFSNQILLQLQGDAKKNREWARETTFDPSTLPNKKVCVSPSDLTETQLEAIRNSNIDSFNTKVSKGFCLFVKRIAIKNILVTQASVSSDGLVHIDGSVQLGFQYVLPYLDSQKLEADLYDTEKNKNQPSLYASYSNVPFQIIMDPKTKAVHVEMLYKQAKNFSHRIFAEQFIKKEQQQQDQQKRESGTLSTSSTTTTAKHGGPDIEYETFLLFEKYHLLPVLFYNTGRITQTSITELLGGWAKLYLK